MANKYKTLPIGTIFTYNGNTYQVCEYDNAFIVSCCSLCVFGNINCDIDKSVRGNCCRKHRSDYRQVYFKLIKDNNKDMDKVNTITPTFSTDNSLNDLYVECPKGYSIDVNNSDLSKGIIKFKNDNITLEDIYENQGKDTFITNVVSNNTHTYNKISAIANLIDIANYYNKDWKPDWNNSDEHKYCIILNSHSIYVIDYDNDIVNTIVYFKNRKDAQDVIDNPNFRDILDAIYKV